MDANNGHYSIEDGLEFDGIDSWALGTVFSRVPPDPIVIELVPLKGYQGLPPEMHDAFMLLMSDRMVNTLRLAGVDNIDCYPAILHDKINEQKFRYQAVNILGLVKAADLDRSEWENLDGEAKLDTHFSKLVANGERCQDLSIFRMAESTGTILVHERLRNALEAAGLSMLQFIPARQ